MNGSLFYCKVKLSYSVADQLFAILVWTGLAMSLLSLLIIIVKNLHKKRNDVSSKFMTGISITLFIGQSLLIVNMVIKKGDVPDWLCTGLAGMQHFTWLSNFCLVTSLTLWLSHNLHRFAGIKSSGNILMPLGLTTPLVIVIVSITMTIPSGKSYTQDSACWLETSMLLPYAFILPIGVCMVVNTGNFIYMLIQIHATSKVIPDSQRSQEMHIAPVAVRLFFLMGFTWIFGFLANIDALDFLWYAFIAFSCFQGFYLYICFGLTRNLRKRFQNFWQSWTLKSTKHSSNI